MGHTLDQWQAKVAELVRDASSVDLTASQIVTVGLSPAIAKFSTDRPRTMATEVAGAGSSYFPLPAGWLPGFSSLTGVEFPARQNPPIDLDGQSWRITRDSVDITLQRILLLDRRPAVGQYVRLYFTAPWPTPTATASDDLIDDLAFEAVSALAASFCCVSLAGEAGRGRYGTLPTDTNQGQANSDRVARLRSLAEMYRSSYDSYVGIGTDASGSGHAPASGSLDFDASWTSLFHGGRR